MSKKNSLFMNKLYFFGFLIIIFIFLYKKKTQIKVGIFGCRHDSNVGNFLIKYAMHIKFTELGYKPFIVTTNHRKVNITFLNLTTNSEKLF